MSLHIVYFLSVCHDPFASLPAPEVSLGPLIVQILHLLYNLGLQKHNYHRKIQQQGRPGQIRFFYSRARGQKDAFDLSLNHYWVQV